MGKIVSSRNKYSNIVLEVEVDYDEATNLKGHYNGIHVFSERVADFSTCISSRGKGSCTKYFLVPKKLRKDIDYRLPVNCQKIETQDRIIFIYVVDKAAPPQRIPGKPPEIA